MAARGERRGRRDAHVVYAFGAAADQGTGLPVFQSKFAVERRIRTLGLAATVLAPVHPWSVPLLEAGKLPVALPPQRPLQQIPVVDVANFAALVIERPQNVVSGHAGPDPVDPARRG